MANLSYIQDVMYEIALQFHDFCIQHNIQYSIAGGSMIGAIRHQDFIPWDDDFDVMLPRADMEKFVALWPGEMECKFGKISMIKIGDPGYHKTAIPIKLYLKHTRVAEINEVECGMPEFNPYGIYLDIFPFDIVEDTPTFRWFNKHWGQILQMKTQSQFHYRYFGRKFKLKLACYKLLPNILLQQITKFIIKQAKNASGTHVIYGLETPFANLFINKEEFFPLQQNCQIRGQTFYGPKCPDAYLTERFGDYMQIPDTSEQYMHIIKVANITDIDDA